MTKNDKNFVIISILGMSISGIFLFIIGEFFQISTEYGMRTNPLLDELKLIHNLFNFIFIFSFGKIFNGHILLGLRKLKKKRIITGNLLFYSTIALAVSGTSLLYVSEEFTRFYLSRSHLLIGLILFLSFLVHFSLNKANK